MPASDLDESLTSAFNKKPVDIPVVAVTGGKGGTGKTTIAVNLAAYLSRRGYQILLVDADADSPTAGIVLGAEPKPLIEVAAFVPRIAADKCDRCRRCVEACRAHAIIQIAGEPPMLFEQLCSGCEACLLACPREAVRDGRKVIGHLHHAQLGNTLLIGGELKPNEARSAQVVTATKDFAFKEEVRKTFDIMIIDAPPGTHCSVVQSLRGADLALAVTEPTPLGIYDLALILELAAKLGVRAQVVVNKADLSGHDREGVLEVTSRYGARVISEVPVDLRLFKSYAAGTPLVIAHPDSLATKAIIKISEYLLSFIRGLH